MANTYTLIQSVTVGVGGAANIDFVSIPATYTDLKLVFSIRTSRGTSAIDGIGLRTNNVSTNQSTIVLYGDGTSAQSYTDTAIGSVAVGNTGVASIFGNAEFYLPNYAASINKSVSADSVQENNASVARMDMGAGLWSQTTAINQLTLYSQNSATILQYSTAYLYGIKNS